MNITFEKWQKLKRNILDLIEFADQLNMKKDKKKLKKILNKIEKRNKL